VREWAEPLGARITRCDIAADDFDGKYLDVRGALGAWGDGAFQVCRNGRKPKASLHDDCGTGSGSTFYVGSREAGKLARIYEKGKQLGDVASRWVRGEVELHSKDRVIPWAVLADPVRYLAGCYPFFAALALVPERIRTLARGAAMSLATATRWVRMVAGKTLNVILRDAGGDLGALLDLRRPGIPRGLRAWYADDGSPLSESVPCGA
jgi:phage replication initiation protein